MSFQRSNKYINTLLSGFKQLFTVRVFDPNRMFRDKRIAIVGPGSTAFDEQNGSYIDKFDYVIRFNRSPSLMNGENQEYIGTKTDIVFHSLFDNAYPEALFRDELGIEFIIHPRNSLKGKRQRLNFFKKHKVSKTIFTLKKESWLSLDKCLGAVNPTMGFCALYSVLNSDFRECFITGFSFYSTGYEKGYEDSFKPGEEYFKFLKSYNSPHDPKLEKNIVFNLIKSKKDTKITLDSYLEKELNGIN